MAQVTIITLLKQVEGTYKIVLPLPSFVVFKRTSAHSCLDATILLLGIHLHFNISGLGLFDTLVKPTRRLKKKILDRVLLKQLVLLPFLR